MFRFGVLLGCVCTAVFVSGCEKTEVSAEDSQKLQKEFSKESYEAAMKRAGKGDKLDAQKRAEESRDQLSGSDPK